MELQKNSLETRIEKMQERFNKDLEEIKKSHSIMNNAGCLGLVHWDDQEGWYGEGGGRRVQDGKHVYTCGGCMFDP